MRHSSTRNRILISSAGIALSLALLMPSAAKADCLPNVDGTIVTCQAADLDGYTAGDGVTINVNTGATVSDTLTVGSPGQINNEGTITVVGTAISTGGGAGIANATAGVLTGDTLMGATTGTQVNVFENFGTATGDVISSGALDFTNELTFTGDVSATTLTFSNTAAGTFTGNVTASDDTLFDNAGAFIGDLTLGDGDDSVANTGTFTGNIDLGDGTNVITFTDVSQLPSGTLTAGVDGDNTLVLDGATGGTFSYAFTNFDVLQLAGTATWELGAAVTLDDSIVVEDGELLTGDADFIGANTVVNNATVTFDNTAGGTFSGDMSGTGSVTVGGGGASVTVFSGANSYSGGTTVSQGTLQLEGGAALSDAGAVTIGAAGMLDVVDSETIGALDNEGAIDLSTGSLTAASMTGSGTIALTGGDLTVGDDSDTTYSGDVSGAGALTKTGEGALTLSGTNSYTGGTTVSEGQLVGTTTSLQGDIVNNAGVTFDQAGAGTYAGDLSGAGTLTKAGVGTLTLSGANSYSGATAISEGELVTNGTGIGDSSAVTIDSGATLTLGGDETIGSLAGEGALDTVTFTLTTGDNNGSTDFAGTASGADIIKVGTGTQTLSGSGTLTGSLDVAGGTIVLGGTYAALTATAASGATLDVGATGDLAADVTGATGSTIRVNGIVTGDIASAGTLTGAGTVVGNVTSSGMLSPGNSPGILTVNGSFTQTSTGILNIEITPTATAGTGYDQVLVTGTPGDASLDGTLALTKASGLYVAGSTYDVVQAAGSITGDFATITGTTISPFVNLADTGVVNLTGGGQAYRLTVVRTNYATGMGSAATANQIATANGFQGLVTGATGDAATLVTAVDNMTVAQAQAFFDQASPEGYGAYATALVDQGDFFTRQIALHQADGTRGVWVRLYASGGEGKADGALYGTDRDSTGVAGGVDFLSNGAFRLGAALGYAEGPLTSELGNSDGDGKSWQAGLYGSYVAGPLTANVQFAYVDTSADVSRSLSGPGVGSRFASADVEGNLWKIVATLGYDLSTGSTMIRPFVGIDHSEGKIKGFTETGSVNAAALSVGRIDADETDLIAGVDLGGSMGSVSPYGRLAYRYNIDGGNRNISAMFNGNSATAFTVSGIEAGRSQFDVDAGISVNAGQAVKLFLGYEGLFRNDIESHGVSAGIRFAL